MNDLVRQQYLFTNTTNVYCNTYGMCYSYKTDPLTGQILPILADRDNHLIDALRYACEAIRRAVPAKTFDVQPLATVSRW